MLRDAALLQLDVLERCLTASLMVKDSSPYNVQWRGASPVFIDIGSFERLREGEPWVAYRQFCMLFLYPLMLQAYKGHRPSSRGCAAPSTGSRPAQARAVMSLRDALRRGVLTNVHLHSRLERALRGGRGPHGQGGRAPRGLQLRAHPRQRAPPAKARRPAALGARARRRGRTTATPARTSTPTPSEKAAFVAAAAGRRRRRLVWDLGANDGAYARIAAQSADYVLAMDVDHPTVERLYRTLRDEGERAHPAARRRRLRPLPRARLARARARHARRPRPARPDALPGARPPHGDHPQRAAARDRRLAGEPRRDRRRRVPAAQSDPMVQRLLARQARRRARGLRPRALRALPAARRSSSSAARELPSGQRVLYEARPLSA